MKIWPEADKKLNQQEAERVEKQNEKPRDFDEKERYKKDALSMLVAAGIIEDIQKEGADEGSGQKAEEEKHFHKEFKELSRVEQELYKLRWENVFLTMYAYRYNKDRLNLVQYLLADEERKIKRESRSAVPDLRTPVTDKLYQAIKEYEKRIKDLENYSPESFIALHLQELKKQIENIQEGRIMETDYVKTMKKWALKQMENGSHIFLHGHLGGGKTDFAVFSAIERMKKLWVEREVGEWIEAETEKGQSPHPEAIMKKIREIQEKYDKGVKNNNEEIMEKVRPYLVAGFKDFSLQDLYVEKTLTTENIFNTTDPIGHSEKIDRLLLRWKEENKERLEQMSKEERDKEWQKQAERLTEIYIEQHKGFGMKVEKIKKEMLRAIEEGKPMIIDEVNAIPTTLLISMNDILTARPGKTAYVPGHGAVEVKEGFSVIMTGNLNNSPLVDYVGTEELNPAFLSRLKIKEYDYLPQNDAGNVFEQENPEKNELFQVLAAFLAKHDGSLKLPQGSLEKIFALAQLAKSTQRVFAGKWKESDVRKSAGDALGEEPALEKAVLSVRNLIAVLNEWNKGREKDLDKALWDAFISGITVPKDQHYIFNLAQEDMGFFRGGRWKQISWDNLKEKETILSWEDVAEISEKEYEEYYQSPENYYYSPRQTVELFYGEAPDRMRFPDVDLEKLANNEEAELDMETVANMEDFLKESQKYIKAIEIALKKEDCLE